MGGLDPDAVDEELAMEMAHKAQAELKPLSKPSDQRNGVKIWNEQEGFLSSVEKKPETEKKFPTWHD